MQERQINNNENENINKDDLNQLKDGEFTFSTKFYNNNKKFENKINFDKNYNNININDNNNTINNKLSLDKKNFEINKIITYNYRKENIKTNEIENNTEPTNNIIDDEKEAKISNYAKALLLSINLGFFSPRKTFSLYITNWLNL